MPKNDPNLNQSTTESGEGGAGVRHSNENVGKVGGSEMASSEQLTLALELSQQALAAKDAEIAKLKAQAQQSYSDNGFNKLAEVLSSLVKPNVQGPTESDNINRTTDFKNTRTAVDGRSLMEAQQVLQVFRNENKVPVSIPKSYINTFGPSLAISVNGVRVSIPCDGKTYFINETHAEHAKERLAKVDNYTADETLTQVEIG